MRDCSRVGRSSTPSRVTEGITRVRFQASRVDLAAVLNLSGHNYESSCSRTPSAETRSSCSRSLQYHIHNLGLWRGVDLPLVKTLHPQHAKTVERWGWFHLCSILQRTGLRCDVVPEVMLRHHKWTCFVQRPVPVVGVVCHHKSLTTLGLVWLSCRSVLRNQRFSNMTMLSLDATRPYLPSAARCSHATERSDLLTGKPNALPEFCGKLVHENRPSTVTRIPDHKRYPGTVSAYSSDFPQTQIHVKKISTQHALHACIVQVTDDLFQTFRRVVVPCRRALGPRFRV